MAAWGPSDYARRASDSPIASKGTWEANGRGGGSFAVLGCATLNRRNWWITAWPLSGDASAIPAVRSCSGVRSLSLHIIVCSVFVGLRTGLVS